MSCWFDMYSQKIKKTVAESKHKPPPTPAVKEAERPLIVQISEWLARLPEDQRGAGYPMEFFTKRFGASQQAIGPVLVELGFRRERLYRKNEAHRRYWTLCA